MHNMFTSSSKNERSNSFGFSNGNLTTQTTPKTIVNNIQETKLFKNTDDENELLITHTDNQNLEQLEILDDENLSQSKPIFDFSLENSLVSNSFILKEDSEQKMRSLDDLTDLREVPGLEARIDDVSVNDTNESSLSSSKKKSTKNSIRKQIQFKLDSMSSENNMDHKEYELNRKTSRSSANLHEKLNQLKNDEIKKRRLSVLMGSRNKKDKQKNIFDFHFDIKEFEKSLNYFQSSIYSFLERPVGPKGFFYRIFTFTIILGSIVTGALTTLKSLDKWSWNLLFWYEIFVTSYFSLEFVLRVWSVGSRTSFMGLIGRLKFMMRPLQIIEMTLIIISIIILSTGSGVKNLTDEIYFKSGALSALRFFQIFRFLYIDRQAQTWVILSKVIHQHRFELLSSVYIGVIILLFSSYFILLFEKPYSEKENDNHFQSYADAFYWSIITMATIGYGDRSPRTFMGKIIATTLCIVGVAFWTLPGGIIGSGFALKVEQKNKKKQFNRLIPAAASLIQAWWRMKATLFISSSHTSCLIATVSTFDISKPIYSTSLRRFKREIDSSTPGNNEEINSYFSGLDSPSTNNENKNILNFHQQRIFNNQKDYALIDNQDDLDNSQSVTHDSEKSKILTSKSSSNYMSSHSSNYSQLNEDSSILLQLSPEHLIIIRTILLLRFFRAQHKFKLAFKPYDFKDVIEQYTQGNMDILLKMKDLQRKIDQVNNNSNLNRPVYLANYSENSAYNSYPNGSPTFSHSMSPPSPNVKLPQTPQSNWSYQNQDSQLKRSLSLRKNNRRFTSNDQADKERSANEINQINNRMSRMEIELMHLSKKLDKIIDCSSSNQNQNQNKTD